MKVSDIKEELIQLGVDPADLNKKKDELLVMLEEHKKLNEEEGYSVEDLKDKKIANIATYGDEDWDLYVMSQFKPNEMVEGNPNVSGLRRVAEVLLGPILESGPIPGTVQSDLTATTVTGRAQSVYEVIFQWKATEGTPIRKFRAAADSFVGNTDP